MVRPAIPVLRPAEPGDALQVATIHVRSWQAAYRGLIPDEYLDALRPEQRAERYTLGDRSPGAPWTTVAVEGSSASAFATTGPSKDPDNGAVGELLALYVDPSRWRCGIGSSLVAHARHELHERGFDAAVVWVLDRNDLARGFYLRDGWATEGKARIEEAWGVRVAQVRYRRSLP